MIRAQLYELLTHNISFDIQYYTEHVQSSDRILELGVGTGRIIQSLLLQDYACTGIDIDPHMISFCSAKYHNLNLYNADIRSFSLEDRFEQVQAPLRVMHLLNQQERSQALSCIKEHLTVGGHAIFHISSWDDQAMNGQWKVSSILPSSDGGEIIIEESMMQQNSCLHILHRFQQVSPHHHVTSTHMMHTTLHPIRDFTEELAQVGFAAQILHQDDSNTFLLAKL